MTGSTPTQLVWVQNLIGFINGQFPADEKWKSIFVEQLAALLPQDTEGEAQPVAWRYSPDNGEHWHLSERDNPCPTNWVKQPLFATPRPAEAIPDDRIDAAIREWMSSDDRSADGFRVRMRAALTAALSSVPGKGEPGAQCCSAVSPCSWQRHHGMDSVCPTCVAASPKPSDPSSPEGAGR